MGNLKSEILVDFNVLNSSSKVAGRLKCFLNYWFHGLKAMDFILGIIKSCYMLPSHHMLDSCYSKKTTSRQPSTVHSLRWRLQRKKDNV